MSYSVNTPPSSGGPPFVDADMDNGCETGSCALARCFYTNNSAVLHRLAYRNELSQYYLNTFHSWAPTEVVRNPGLHRSFSQVLFALVNDGGVLRLSQSRLIWTQIPHGGKGSGGKGSRGKGAGGKGSRGKGSGGKGSRGKGSGVRDSGSNEDGVYETSEGDVHPVSAQHRRVHGKPKKVIRVAVHNLVGGCPSIVSSRIAEIPVVSGSGMDHPALVRSGPLQSWGSSSDDGGGT